MIPRFLHASEWWTWVGCTMKLLVTLTHVSLLFCLLPPIFCIGARFSRAGPELQISLNWSNAPHARKVITHIKHSIVTQFTKIIVWEIAVDTTYSEATIRWVKKNSKKCEKMFSFLIFHINRKYRRFHCMTCWIGVYNYFSYLSTRSLHSFLDIQPVPVLPAWPVLDHFPLLLKWLVSFSAKHVTQLRVWVL